MLRCDNSKQTVVVEVANNPWSMLLNLLIHDLFVENSMDVSSATRDKSGQLALSSRSLLSSSHSQ